MYIYKSKWANIRWPKETVKSNRNTTSLQGHIGGGGVLRVLEHPLSPRPLVHHSLKLLAHTVIQLSQNTKHHGLDCL